MKGARTLADLESSTVMMSERVAPEAKSAAATDIRLKPSFRNSVDRDLLVSRLGPQGALAAIDLWLYACESRYSGDFSGKTDEQIEIAAGWPKEHRGEFIEGMIAVGWLSGDAGKRKLYKWREHQPHVADALKYKLDGAFGGLKSQHPQWTDDQIIREISKREALSSGDVRSNLKRYAPAPAPAPRRGKRQPRNAKIAPESEGEGPSKPPSTPPSTPSSPSVPTSPAVTHTARENSVCESSEISSSERAYGDAYSRVFGMQPVRWSSKEKAIAERLDLDGARAASVADVFWLIWHPKRPEWVGAADLASIEKLGYDKLLAAARDRKKSEAEALARHHAEEARRSPPPQLPPETRVRRACPICGVEKEMFKTSSCCISCMRARESGTAKTPGDRGDERRAISSRSCRTSPRAQLSLVYEERAS